MDKTLKALLLYSKQQEQDLHWKSIVKNCLGELYNYDMKQSDVLFIISRELQFMSTEKKFQSNFHLDDLLLAPTNWLYNNNITVNRNVLSADIMSIEGFYDSIICYIMSKFRYSRVDWCRDELYGEN
jgi:hypothetical protein